MSDLHDMGNLWEERRDTGAEGTFSAGEVGEAVDGDGAGVDAGLGDVIIGEIPDARDLARMLWTARCTSSASSRQTRRLPGRNARSHF